MLKGTTGISNWYGTFLCSSSFRRIVVLVHMGLFGTSSLIAHRGEWVCVVVVES